jgi:hypothetical protein
VDTIRMIRDRKMTKMLAMVLFSVSSLSSAQTDRGISES